MNNREEDSCSGYLTDEELELRQNIARSRNASGDTLDRSRHNSGEVLEKSRHSSGEVLEKSRHSSGEVLEKSRHSSGEVLEKSSRQYSCEPASRRSRHASGGDILDANETKAEVEPVARAEGTKHALDSHDGKVNKILPIVWFYKILRI